MIARLNALVAELNRRICGLTGHRPSWVLAVALGYLDRPVCADCGRVLARQPPPA